MKLKIGDLKKNAIEKKPSRLHITDFNIERKEELKHKFIYYICKQGFCNVLKQRGCIKPLKYKMCAKRKLNF
jgi:hypothetical protein